MTVVEIRITESSFRPAHPGVGPDPASAYLPSIQTFTDRSNRDSPPGTSLALPEPDGVAHRSRGELEGAHKEHNMIWAVALGMAIVGFGWVKVRRQRKAQSASQ